MWGCTKIDKYQVCSTLKKNIIAIINWLRYCDSEGKYLLRGRLMRIVGNSKCMERDIKNNLTGIQIPGISHGLLSFQPH